MLGNKHSVEGTCQTLMACFTGLFPPVFTFNCAPEVNILVSKPSFVNLVEYLCSAPPLPTKKNKQRKKNRIASNRFLVIPGKVFTGRPIVLLRKKNGTHLAGEWAL